MERRRFKRIFFSKEVEFLYKGENKKGYLKNISLGGIFIQTKDLPDIKEEILITLKIDGIEPPVNIIAKGKVIRIESGRGFAVKFTEIDPESFKELKNLIKYNAPAPEEIEKEIIEFLAEANPLIRVIKKLNIEILKQELIPYILEKAFLYNPENPFILSSGKKSPYYLDCRKITLYAPSFKIIGELFWEEIRFLNIQGVLGMSVGADPIVCSVLSKASQEDIDLKGFFVRKEPKKHGTQRQIEGDLSPGLRVVVVEDVVTTGKSVLKAIECAEKEKLQIIKVLALIDRGEGGKENIESKGYPFYSFFTFDEIIKEYHNRKIS